MRCAIILALLLSGCATSEYKQGCQDALAGAFTGPYQEWEGSFCDRLDSKHEGDMKPRDQTFTEIQGRK
jgi:hypothetical protein